MKKVAFICVHNSCRSQIAEALGKHLASDVFESYSAGPDLAISMGCNVGCPFIGRPFDDNWELEDPTGKSDVEFKKIIDKIKVNVLELRRLLEESSDFKI